jgi:hypothetical protein
VLIQYIRLHSDALSPRLEEKDRVVTISRMLLGRRLRTRSYSSILDAVRTDMVASFAEQSAS